VSIDYDACIGCRYCMLACPYDAFEFNAESPRFADGLEPGHGAAEVETRSQGVVEKCTFCVHRVDRDLDPACVSVCPTDAILFGDLADPDSRVAREAQREDAFRVGEELGVEPNVYYRPLRRGRKQRRSCPPASG
jgi:molybdopterin-containing oxidoreductase family iron-sulfur binding subunit